MTNSWEELTRRVDELEQTVRDLRERADKLVSRSYAVGVVLVCVLLLTGLVVPFLTAAEPGQRPGPQSISLLPSIFELRKAGNGPFQGDATASAIAVAGYCVLVVVVLISVACLPLGGRGWATWTMWLSGVLLVGTACAWLLVLALAGHFDGRVDMFSPALLCILVAGIGAIPVARHAIATAGSEPDAHTVLKHWYD